MRVERLFTPFSFRRSRGALSVYDYQIKDVVTDPACASSQTVYVCVRTPLCDGHGGVAEAYARGCRCFLAARGLGLPPDAAVYTTEDPSMYLGELAARCFGYPARSLTVLGITGEVGKTSVADTLTRLLREAGHKVATLTTDGFDVDGAFQKAGYVAPNAADVQRMLRSARRAGAAFAVVELSAYMLSQNAHKSIPFAALLQTAPLREGDTVRRHSAADYRRIKEILITCGAPLLFLPYGTEATTERSRVLYIGQAGDVTGTQAETVLREDVCGTRFHLGYQGEKFEVFYPVVGDFAVKNATAAAALALAAGLPPGDIARGLAHSAPIGRLEQIYASGGRRIFLDAAYEAEDLQRVLRVLRDITRGRLLVLLGSVGGRARARRAPLGTAAVMGADFVYFTADDPDTESPCEILRDMVEEIENSPRYACIPMRQNAIIDAVSDMCEGDVLLILGKPRDDTQLVRGVRQDFSDRHVAVAAVEQYQG